MAAFSGAQVDIPSDRTPLPSPLATAPAQTAFRSFQDSLSHASEDGSMPPAVRVIRAKPNPLNFMSANSMISIQESPKVGRTLTVPKDPMQFLSGQSVGHSVPPTPAYHWGGMATPGETPQHFGTMTYSSQPAATPTGTFSLATPTAAAAPPARATLSLAEMVQSPKVEHKQALLSSFHHQIYQAPMPMPVNQWLPQQHVTQAPPQPTMVHTVPASAPPMASSMVYAAPPMQAPAGPSAAQMFMPAPAGQSAAQMLGLVMQAPAAPRYSVASPVTGSLHPISPSTMPPPQSPHLASGSMFASSGPPAPQYAAPQQVFRMPVYAAPPMPPPPPFAPAPMVVMSPKAVAAPQFRSGASEEDIKVLLEMAVASGKQEAIDAVMRQAQNSGISAERFRSLLPAPVTNA